MRTTFNLSPENDWRYTPVRKQPSVIPPPAKFKIDPYYTKFTWAREFPVVGSDKVSDEALLKANDTIRKMFAYRHDVLKAFINDGWLIVGLLSCYCLGRPYGAGPQALQGALAVRSAATFPEERRSPTRDRTGR